MNEGPAMNFELESNLPVTFSIDYHKEGRSVAPTLTDPGEEPEIVVDDCRIEFAGYTFKIDFARLSDDLQEHLLRSIEEDQA